MPRRLDAVVRRMPLLAASIWSDWHAGTGVTSAGLTGTSILVARGIQPPKAASNTWTCCSRPNVRNAGSARKSGKAPSCVNGSRPYHAGAQANGETTCAKPPANGLTPRACAGNVWNVEAKRYGRQDDMRSWTHRPLRNVNASTRGLTYAPEPATRRMASAF